MTQNSVKMTSLGIGQKTSVICKFMNTELLAYCITLYLIFLLLLPFTPYSVYNKLYHLKSASNALLLHAAIDRQLPCYCILSRVTYAGSY